MMDKQDELARAIAKLSEAQRGALIEAEELVDGRILVPAYSVPDHMTSIYSVHRSALNRVGIAARAALSAAIGEDIGGGRG